MTTPQPAAQRVAERAAAVATRLEQRIVGVIENMSYRVCPCCGERDELFGSGGGALLAEHCGAPLLGQVPLEPALREGSDTRRAGDRGRAGLAGGPGHPRHRRAHPRVARAGPGRPHPPPADRPLAPAPDVRRTRRRSGDGAAARSTNVAIREASASLRLSAAVASPSAPTRSCAPVAPRRRRAGRRRPAARRRPRRTPRRRGRTRRPSGAAAPRTRGRSGTAARPDGSTRGTTARPCRRSYAHGTPPSIAVTRSQTSAKRAGSRRIAPGARLPPPSEG